MGVEKERIVLVVDVMKLHFNCEPETRLRRSCTLLTLMVGVPSISWLMSWLEL